MEELDDSKLVDVATAMRQTGMSYPHKRVVSEDDDGIMLLLGVLYVGWIIFATFHSTKLLAYTLTPIFLCGIAWVVIKWSDKS